MSVSVEELPPDITDGEWDAVSVTSTVESEPKDPPEYEVEEILADRLEDGYIQYLTRWTNYPLHRATWEPGDSFTGGNMINEWKRKKQSIKKGEAAPFDLDKYYKAADEDRRHAIRDVLRSLNNDRDRARQWYKSQVNSETRKPQQPNQHHDSEPTQLDQGAGMPSRQVQQPEPSSINSPGESPQDEAESDADDIPFTRAWQSIKGRKRKLIDEDDDKDNEERDEGEVPDDEAQNESTGGSMDLDSSSDTEEGQLAPPETEGDKAQGADSRSTLNPEASKTTALRSNPTNTGSKKGSKTGAALFENWGQAKDKSRRTRNQQGQFRYLSQLNRYQKGYGKERAPNIEDMEFVDEAPKENARSHPIPTRGELSSARRLSDATVTAAAPPAQPRKSQMMNKVPLTCWHYLYAQCTRKDCPFLHSEEGSEGTSDRHGYVPPKYWVKPVTCWYWWHHPSGCHRPERDCNFAHKNTGLIASTAKSSGDDTIQVDKESLPLHLRPKPVSGTKRFTCWYWWNEPKGCFKSESSCKFSHRNTGKLAGIGRAAHTIDIGPDELPLFQRRRVSTNNTGLKDVSQSHLAHSSVVGPVPIDSLPVGQPQAQGAVAQAPHRSGANEEDHQMRDASPPPSRRSSDALSLPHHGPAAETPQLEPPIKVDLSIVQGSSKYTLLVQLSGLDGTRAASLLSEFGPHPHLQVKTMCFADYFKSFFWEKEQRAFVGDVMAEPESLKDMESFSGFLKSVSCGAVAMHRELAILLYPPGLEAWNFLKGSHTCREKTQLCLYAQVARFTSADLDQAMRKEDEEGELELTKPHPVTAEDLLFGTGSSPNKGVFLLYDEEHNKYEIEWLVRILQSAGVRVWSASTPGAWDHFRRRGVDGAILAHPDFWRFDSVPGFRDILERGSRVNIFRIGWETPEVGERWGDLVYQRLFPHGTALLITDDVWLYHTEKAYGILEQFYGKIKSTREGSGVSNWKMAARPGLKAWLTQAAERSAMKKARGRTGELLKVIYGLDDVVPYDSEDILSVDNDSSFVSPEGLENYETIWEENEEGATNYLAEWFAGWCLENMEKYRRFVIVHPTDNKQWAKRWQHVKVAPVDGAWDMLNSKRSAK